ncbi:MAG: hypothetical protein O3A97_10375 [Proteobacteria bacterium]|nr:hypothetical protein [Pseudomonadota bacterium]
MSIDPNILIVIAVLVVLLATASLVAGWVNRIWSWPAFAALIIGVMILGFLHLSVIPGGLGPHDLPMAFIHVAAMVMN